MVYQIMFYGGLILAIISIILAIVLFFKLNIGKVVGDLTGYNAKHDIKLIRENGIESGSKKSKIKDMTTKLLVKEQNTSTTATIRRDYISNKNKKSDSSTDKIKLMQDLEADKKKQEYAKKKAQETFRGNGVYRSGAISESLSDETQIIKDTTVKEKESGFTVIEEATSLLSEEIGSNILVSDEEREILLNSQEKEIDTDILDSEDEITDVLFNEESTSVLTDDVTDVLLDEEGTSVLTDDVTDVLLDEEGTSILSDEITDVLSDEVGTSVLFDEETEVLGKEEDTSLLYEDIFTSLEDTVVHHTDETMN